MSPTRFERFRRRLKRSDGSHSDAALHTSQSPAGGTTQNPTDSTTTTPSTTLQSQGNANDGYCETEVSAIPTVNHPPSVILISAQPALPTTGEASETVTEAPPPQSLPDSLWAQAYDEVQKDDPELTEAYTKLLNNKLGLASGTNLAAGNNIGNQTIWGQRQAQFTRLVECGLERTKKAFDTKERIHEGTRLLKSVTELISTSLKHAPQAATAWAGVCLLVQAFENPTTEAKAFLDGVSHVTNRMEWYSSLSTPLLDSQSPHDALQDQLKKRIISLYRKLLIYLIKAICYLFKSSAVVILGDMVKLYDWDSGLKALKDAEQGLRGDISVLHDTAMTQSLKELVVSTKDRQQSEQEVQCLRHLLLSDPRHDKVRIKDTKGGLFEGASSWIFHHEQYLRWRQHDDTKLIWVKGDPGKGKTMLMISIVEKLEEEIKQPGNSSTLAYFLCQGTNKDLDNATAVLRGLIYFLAASNRQLVTHLRKQYDISGPKLFEGRNSFHALSIILESMICDKSLAQTYIAIDALDECTHNRDQLLKLITKLITVSPHTKWLVTSRNRPEIEEILSIDEPEIRLSLEITANAEQVAKAVDAFIDFKISKLPALKNDHDKKCKVQNLMRERASGTFLWVALVVGVLEKAKPWNILDKLKGVPAGLNEIYDSIMDQVKAQDDWEYCQAILAVATLAYRPLHITELGTLCRLPYEILSDEGNMRDMIGLCGSFLTLQEHGLVYLIHQSAKDYLSDTAADEVFSTGLADAHFNILHMSIQGMQGSLRKDMYNLRRPGVLTEDIATPNPDPLQSIRYSCVSWIGHFCDSYHASTPHGKKVLTTLVYDFIQQYYLYWLEALALIRHVGDGLLAIMQLQSLLKEQSPNQQLIELVHDCYRFNREHHWVIDNAPLQIYSSALIFSPTESLVRNLFNKDVSDWVMIQPTVDRVWSPCQQILKLQHLPRPLSGPSFSLAFSPDYRFLAVGCYSDGIVVWDAATGILLRVIDVDNGTILSVTFSPDSKFLASSSYDTLNIWEVETGTLCRTLEGGSGLKPLAYSPDSKFLASGSYGTLNLWEAETGTLYRTLEGGSGLCSVAYSPDCKLLASGFRSGRIRLWEVPAGILRWEVGAHGDTVTSVAFSLDSKLLASGSRDETVKIWDLETGKLQQKFSACAGSVTTVAFYDNTGVLVSGYEDGTVRLWDVAEETLQEEPERHEDTIEALAFSPDSMFLASYSRSRDDATITIWEMATGARCYTLKKLSKPASFIEFSPDSKLLAARLSEGCYVWEAATGALQYKIDGNRHGDVNAAFSPDSKFLSLGHSYGRVQIWKAETGVLHRTLVANWNSEYESMKVAFSPDSKTLASGCRGATINIWDVATGNLRRTLAYNGYSPSVMSFSTDSKRLAASSSDNMVRVWDIETGDLQLAQRTGERYTDWMALCQDPRLLGSGPGDSSTINTCDLATRALRRSLAGYHDPASSVILTPGSGPNEMSHLSFYIGQGDSWIYCNDERLLRLPPDCRVSVSAMSHATLPLTAPTVKIALVFGLRPGQVIIIGLRASGPYGGK